MYLIGGSGVGRLAGGGEGAVCKVTLHWVRYVPFPGTYVATYRCTLLFHSGSSGGDLCSLGVMRVVAAELGSEGQGR